MPDGAIQRMRVDGKQATVVYFGRGFVPVEPDQAEMIKIIFDDGDVKFFSTPPKTEEKGWDPRAEDVDYIQEEWDESKHPRGQPENAGQFGPGGGGSETEGGGERPAAQQEEQPLSAFNFSKEEIKTLKAYTQRAYIEINRFMRGKSKAEGADKKELERLVGTIKGALKKSALPGQTTLYRAIGGGSKTSNKLRADHNAEKMVGKAMPLGGFQSTTWDFQTAVNFDTSARVFMVFDVPANTPALSMKQLSSHPEENEYLLNDGQFTVTRVERVDGEGGKYIYIHGSYAASAP